MTVANSVESLTKELAASTSFFISPMKVMTRLDECRKENHIEVVEKHKKRNERAGLSVSKTQNPMKRKALQERSTSFGNINIGPGFVNESNSKPILKQKVKKKKLSKKQTHQLLRNSYLRSTTASKRKKTLKADTQDKENMAYKDKKRRKRPGLVRSMSVNKGLDKRARSTITPQRTIQKNRLRKSMSVQKTLKRGLPKTPVSNRLSSSVQFNRPPLFQQAPNARETPQRYTGLSSPAKFSVTPRASFFTSAQTPKKFTGGSKIQTPSQSQSKWEASPTIKSVETFKEEIENRALTSFNVDFVKSYTPRFGDSLLKPSLLNEDIVTKDTQNKVQDDLKLNISSIPKPTIRQHETHSLLKHRRITDNIKSEKNSDPKEVLSKNYTPTKSDSNIQSSPTNSNTTPNDDTEEPKEPSLSIHELATMRMKMQLKDQQIQSLKEISEKQAADIKEHHVHSHRIENELNSIRSEYDRIHDDKQKKKSIFVRSAHKIQKILKLKSQKENV